MPPKRTVELVENMLKFARHYRDLSSWQRVKEKCILMHLFPNLLETEDTKPLSDFWANNFVKADSWVQRDFAPQTFTAAMRRALRADDTPAQAIVQVEAAHANEQLKLGDMHEELRLIVKQTKKKDIMISSAPNTQQGEVTALAVAPTAPADLARIYDDAAEQKAKRANNTQVRRETVQEQSRKRSAERDLIMTHLVQSQAITLALASLIASQASGPMQPKITSLINSLSALPALPAASPPAAISTVVDTITPAAAGATPSSADPPKSTADAELIPDADEDFLVTIPPKIARK